MNTSVFSSCRIFEDIPDGQIEDLIALSNGVIKKFKKDEIIIQTADTADEISIILSGLVSVRKISESGNIIEIGSKVPGDMIGEAAVFSKAHIYPCELTAEKETEIFTITRQGMLRVLSSNSKALENFLTELSTQTFVLQSRIELLAHHGTAQRLASFLNMRSMMNGGTNTIEINGSMMKLSTMLNVSRTTLHREVTELEKRGIISRNGKTITIMDRNALQRVIEKE